MYRYLLLWATFLLLIAGCTREKTGYSTEATVSLGIDTLHFDTLFTQSGSRTFRFRIYNNNDSRIRLSSVWLAGGSRSIFHINVNGQQGPEITNLDINANDSAHVFVNAYIPPSAGNLPFVVNDSIGIMVNGYTQWVQLEAWAQNAHYLKNAVINSNTTWSNDLPYVILGPLQVGKGVTLTIEKGVKVYCHADAAFQINGSLLALGDSADGRIVFAGDRFDPPYSDYPATWPGIRLGADSRENLLQYVSIRNAYSGIISEVPMTSYPSLVLEQAEIRNMLDVGLMATRSHIRATNTVFLNCGRNIRLYQGGEYYFTHCSIATFSNNYFPHKEPVVLMTDYGVQGTDAATAALSAIFTNCIVWGEGQDTPDEFVTDRRGSEPFNIQYNFGIWKMQLLPSTYNTVGTITNADPLFVSTGKGNIPVDLHLLDGSPAIGLGTATGIRVDLDGRPRALNNSAAGAFEKQ